MQRVKVQKVKQSLYMNAEFLAELNAEAKRLDRSLSWLVTQIWSLSKEEIQKIPAQADAKDAK